MIISKAYALRLIRRGKAKEECLCFDKGMTFMAIIRFDLQRIDHYLIGEGDLR